MAVLVWLTLGIAIWHFAVFVPDRFRGGIIGAFAAASLGAVVSGAAFQIALGKGVGETDIATALAAVPGAVLGLAVVYAWGSIVEAREAELG